MFRRPFIAISAILALAFAIPGTISTSEAKQLGSAADRFSSRADHYAYPDYYERMYGFGDCRYRWVVVKKWNKARTKLVKVNKKRWVC